MITNKKALIIANLSGFLWKFELNDVRILQELGYEIHYASNIYEKGYYFELDQMCEKGIIFHHIDIARSPYMFKMNLTALKQVIRIIDDEGIELIHCHTPVGGLLGRIAGVKSRSKPVVIYTAHGFHFYQGAPLLNNTVYQFVERMLAPVTDAMVLINHEDYIAAKTMQLRNSGKIYQIPGVGIDFSYFSPVSINEKRNARQYIGIDQNAFFVLSVGELNINKNHKMVIQAIKQIIIEHRIESQIIYGICGDGFFREDIKKFAKEIGLEHNVIFFGYQENIKEYYAASDLTVFPSLREGLGMVGLESLAMGIPVIAADNRGTREYMVDGENGFVFKPMDVYGCIEGILRIYQMTPEERKQMSMQCVKSSKRFSKEVSCSIMKEVYRDVSRE